MTYAVQSSKEMTILSRLLLSSSTGAPQNDAADDITAELTQLTREQFDRLAALASLNHVIVRAFDIARDLLVDAQDTLRADWMQSALQIERARVDAAIPILHDICTTFAAAGHDLMIIKSLDHWPDLGSDLDLYTNTESELVISFMKKRFHAELEARSWGDRLAAKWNFRIPGLAESVEIHMGRLGQTGEQKLLAARLVERSRSIQIDGRTFRVAAVSDRIMISTLQRMYRHFFFRLCDVVDTAEVSQAGAIDYTDLREAATASGIWEGTATYLAIVSDYVKQFRGEGLDLPRFVTESARFGGEEIYFAHDFLRVPILPESARLYGTQLAGLLKRGQLQSGVRLSLLPWLATAAAVGQKVTGSDKGIW